MKRILLAALLVSACSPQSAPAPASATTPAAPAGVDKEGMDTSVAAGNDFNAYVNGAWLKKTEIPVDKSSYGPFNILSDLTRKQTQELIQNASGKVGDFYTS